MILLPAVDVVGGKAVRLTRGDYDQMTVYSDAPWLVARSFHDAGARWMHVVDLEGARDGTTENFDTIKRLIVDGGLKTEVGGGIRSQHVIEQYLDAGAARVILGTAAITQPGFVGDMVTRFGGDKIAVGVDVKNGFVAIKGWTEVTEMQCLDFCQQMAAAGVKTIICTDISKDGVLGGTNQELYAVLTKSVDAAIIASGGVSSVADITALSAGGLGGAILGKALYEKRLDLKEALKAAGSQEDVQ